MNSLQVLNLAAPMADTYNQLEEMLLCHIAEQLAANHDTLINATSQWRIKMLAQMGRLTADTTKIIAQMTGKAPEMVEDVVSAAVDKVLDEYGLTLTEKLSDNIFQSLKSYDLQAVKSKYNQVNTVMQYKAKQLYTKSVNGMADRFMRIQQKALENTQEYLDVLNKNAMAVTLGEKSRTEALRETIAEMNSKGIPAFVDASGREWSPEAYINMDIRNTAKNSALAAEFASLDELDLDVILVSSHSGARPKCFPYQGGFYSRKGNSGTITDAKGNTFSYSPWSETSFGEPDGLLGINCGHRIRGVSDGTFVYREHQYDQDENDEEYKRVQHQRQKERQIRKEKMQANMLDAAGDSEGASIYRRKADEHDRELRSYCGKNGLSYRADRTGDYGYKNTISNVDKTAGNDIIEEAKKLQSVEDVKSFAELKSYMEQTYGIKVSDSVENLDFQSVKEGTQGIECIMQEFPQARSSFKFIDTHKGGLMSAGYDGDINFNPGYYSTRENAIKANDGGTSHLHPKGNNIFGTACHEAGHILEKALVDNANGGETAINNLIWDDGVYAKSIVSDACKAAKKLPECKGMINSQLISAISDYALKGGDSECLAEAVCDYMINGENAAPLSKEIWAILKRELG